MFEYVYGADDRPLRDRSFKPALWSVGVHVVAIGILIAVPFFFVTEQLPSLPTISAFVVPAPSAPPPPPPPPPARAKAPAAKPPPQAVAAAGKLVAPVGAPAEIARETGIAMAAPEQLEPIEHGVEGGVEGGIPGGVPGGIVGGLPSLAPPPPPAPKTPVRIGGQIKQPTLVHRVDPIYPDFAVTAQVEGVVILEAMVDTDGRVQTVTVLRSRGLLDRAAIDAVKQWRYSPLVLNGVSRPFILTVTVSFSLERP